MMIRDLDGMLSHTDPGTPPEVRPARLLSYLVDIESFWTEGYAGQIPNSGHELAIYVL